MDADELADYERSDPQHAEAVIVARFAALYGFRNTELENFHAGKSPTDENGSTKDTVVVCGTKEIAWDKVGRLSDQEMRTLMLSIEKQLTFVVWAILDWERRGEMPETVEMMKKNYFSEAGISWDRPPKRWQEIEELRRQIRAKK